MTITQIENKTEYELTLEDAYIKIGGDTEKFLPEISFNKWNNNAWIKFNHANTIVAAQKETFIDGVLHLIINGIEHKYYIDENNNLEYEIILKSRPQYDYIELDIDFSENIIFEPQGTLSDEWNNSPGLQLLHPKIDDFLYFANRPDNVINSIAGYINDKNNAWKTGKVFHFYRPTIEDANKNKIWLTFTINRLTKKLRIYIEKAFLDSATYPLVLGPTIGYSTAGASSYGSNTTKVGTVFTAPASGGTTTLYHIAISAAAATNGLKQAIYNTSGSSPANQSLVEQITTTASVTDDLQTAGGGATISASTEYWLGYIPEDAGTKIKYDSVGTNETAYQTSTTYGAEFADPFGAVTATIAWRISMWVDYAGAATGNPWYYYAQQNR